ncbi:MAG: (d)CMP kinase [Acidobacteriota bacterium]|nr:(d)CMP kinase [Acidobacteriota bacterium]
MSGRVQVAIDGPAGAGKSSVARGLARALGYTYIDTGAMYRAVAYRASQAGFNVQRDAGPIGDLAGTMEFEFRDVNGEQHLFVDGEDVSEIIRTPEVGNLSSPVSAIPAVREHLVAAQRRMAGQGGTVMEGRDIGTVVLPGAQVKVFLTATDQERARRREHQLVEMGIAQPFDQILADIRERDHRDSTRAVAPLKKADDAIEIVSDNMTKDQVIAELVRIVRTAEEAI